MLVFMSLRFHKGTPLLLIFGALASGLCGGSASQSSGAEISYLSQPDLWLQSRTEKSDYFYTTCEYLDSNDFRGRVLFLSIYGVDYLIQGENGRSEIHSIIPFRRTSSGFSLGFHHGSNGSNAIIREFLENNINILDGRWIFGRGSLNDDAWLASSANQCIAPRR